MARIIYKDGCDGCGLYLRYMAAPIVLLDVTADAFKKRTAGSVAPQGVRAELPF